MGRVNKPKFNIFKNVIYALEGAKTVLKSEKSFKIQLIIIAVIGLVLLFIDLSTCLLYTSPSPRD